MTISQTRYESLIRLAKQKLREGKRRAAKEVAHFAVVHYPNGFEGWLILGGLSAPENRMKYLSRAKDIAPSNPLVINAMAWASTQSPSRSLPPRQKAAPIEFTQPIRRIPPIPSDVVTENRYRVWVGAGLFIILLTALFFGMGLLGNHPNLTNRNFSMLNPASFIKPSQTFSPDLYTGQDILIEGLSSNTPEPTIQPSPTPTPTIIPDLFGCSMEISFISGPVVGEGTNFTMLAKSYFYDKGDKFDIGKNTGIFYDDLGYVILHSGYQDGNLLSPLEIEFLRKYLELWGNSGTAYIEDKIQELKGSEVIWRCDNRQVMTTIVEDVIRLSHDASNQLWLEPYTMFQLIDDRPGIASEWVGELDYSDKKSIYLGFCGWGPPEISSGRSVYYRYLVRLSIVD